jgi:diadenosine tetraphosphatase ApaH/serine/threonine PP2A family protein phosphatase
MYAIISDLHSNLPALKAVFEDIDAQGVTEVLCLGDVVGYGPWPVECLRLTKQRAKLTLLGNHDEALMGEPLNFNATAHAVVKWTEAQMPRDDPEMDELWDYLGDMQMLHEQGPDMFVHGSPRDPTQEYLMPKDAASGKYDEVFDDFERLLFVGHTHIPCVITPDRNVRLAKSMNNEYRLDAEKATINVGSVGQPRDRDPRACYVVVEDDLVRWRRVAYDLDATIAKLEEAGLPPELGARLRDGK